VGSASTKCHCSGLRKCVAMVLSSRNGQNVDWQTWSDQFSRCGRALGCVVEHVSWVEMDEHEQVIVDACNP